MDKGITVSEYAQLTGKDPGNIRRMLASGRLEGIKIGNQWVIPSNAVYPADRREKTGKYRNWRRRARLSLYNDMLSVIRPMIKDYSLIYGDLLEKVVLYGSYARGEQTDESDVDIAIILRDKPSAEMTDKMIDRTAQSELQAGKVLSVIDIQKDQYEYWKDVIPFYRNIEKEGIVLWKAA